MGFLAPWLLAGLAAAGLPVYLHLLRQHRTTPRLFSSLMFFERSTQSSIKHRRIRFWTLLLFRLAFLVLLVLAFAGPFVARKAGAAADGKRLVLYVVDNSLSMRESDRLERAKRSALEEASGREAGQEGQVATLAARLELETQPTADGNELAAAIQAIRPVDGRSSYGELARALRALGETARHPLEVHFFSDLQQSSMPSGFVDLQLPSSARFVLHPVVDGPAANFAVESVSAPVRLFRPDPATVQATVVGLGTQAARQTVSLIVNGTVIDSQAVDVPENGRVTVEFHSLAVPYGFNRCEVAIRPSDRLPEDDRFLFAVERADPRPALFLHGGGGRDLLYFRAAIEASRNAAFTLQAAGVSQDSGIDPARYSVVVLADPGALPPELERALRQYVLAGGALLIAGGPATARLSRIPVMDLPVVESRFASRTGERFFAAGEADASHPAVVLRGLWEGVKFYQAVRVDASEARTLARLADGTPLLVERLVGEGRVLLFASTFDNLANDFPLHPAFVAFVERAMNYLGRIEERSLQRTVDEYVDLRRGGDGGSALEVLGPDGARLMSLEEAARMQSFRVERTGFYELRRANQRHEMVAVNADRRESNLALIPEETRSLWQNTGSGTVSGGETPVGTPPVRYKVGWYVLLAGLLAAAGETIVSAMYLGVGRGAA